MQVVLNQFHVKIDVFWLLATTNTLFEGEAGKELNHYSAGDEAASPQMFEMT